MGTNIERKVEIGKKYLQTIIDLETGIREETINVNIKPIKDILYTCYFCNKKIEDFVVELILKTEIGTETYRVDTDCYYKAKKGYFLRYLSVN